MINACDTKTEEWLGRCTVGRLRENFNLSLIQMQFGQTSILFRVLKVKVLICMLSFLDKEDKEIFLARYLDMFAKWFLNVHPSENLDIAKPNRA